jgi:hypothetical protein
MIKISPIALLMIQLKTDDLKYQYIEDIIEKSLMLLELSQVMVKNHPYTGFLECASFFKDINPTIDGLNLH